MSKATFCAGMRAAQNSNDGAAEKAACAARERRMVSGRSADGADEFTLADIECDFVLTRENAHSVCIYGVKAEIRHSSRLEYLCFAKRCHRTGGLPAVQCHSSIRIPRSDLNDARFVGDVPRQVQVLRVGESANALRTSV